MARRKKGARVIGPFPDRVRGCWRVKYIDVEGGTSHERCETEQQANALANLLRAKAEAENREYDPGITVNSTIEKYERYLKDEKGNKPKSIKETIRRLRAFLGVPADDTSGEMLRSITPTRAKELYEAECSRMIGEGDKARAVSVDTHRNVLAETKTWAKWCVERSWIKANPFDAVKGRGRRKKGKVQLRIDEARKWTAKAIEWAEDGKPGAIAALMALLMDLRSSEIVTRVVRDLDDDGQLLWIPEAKTPAGKRTVEVPEILRPYLTAMAKGRPSDQLLFGKKHWADWPTDWVQKICKASGVTMVTAHGLRGTHSSFAVERGMSSKLVAAAMGHESDRTTLGGSYATREAQASAKQKRALSTLGVN